MALTLAGRQLTAFHRTAQARLSAQTTARLLQVWPLLDINALDATTAQWLAAAVPIIEQSRLASAALASAYVSTLRPIETSLPPLALPPLPPASIDRIRTSLLVMGPIAIKAAMTSGRPIVVAGQTASFTSSAAGARQALSGGRDLITAATQADPQARGMVRVTSPGACAFCEEIAGYSETNPALGGDFQCHDGCHCQPEPVYG